MKVSQIQLKAELKAIQEAHVQINSFYWGDLIRATKERNITYPLMCCYVVGTPAAFNGRITQLPLAIVIVDKVYKGKENLDDTQSDALQVCHDIYEVMDYSVRWRKLLKVISASVTPTKIDWLDDEVTGQVMQMVVGLKDKSDLCGLPFYNYPYEGNPPSSSCSDGLVVNSTLTYTLPVPSGQTVELPDITHIDSDGESVVLPAQQAMVCSPPEPTNRIIYQRPHTSGQTTAVLLYDEGWHSANGTYSDNPAGINGRLQRLDYESINPYNTLLYNNEFGNKDRFTDIIGGQNYNDEYVIDNLTGYATSTRDTAVRLGFTDNISNLLSGVHNLNYMGYSDWRVMNTAEYQALSDNSQFRWWRVAPFEASNIDLITSSLLGNGVGTKAEQYGLYGAQSLTSTSSRALIIRNHFTY